MKNSVGFTVSRILGVYPFDDLGPSRKWLYISMGLRVLLTVWSVKNFYDYLMNDDNVIVTVLSLLWVFVVRVIPLVHLVCVGRNQSFFESTKPVLNQRVPWYCTLMLAIEITYYSALIIDLEWLPNNSLLTAVLFVWDFALNDLIRFQYVVIIEAESKRIERLRESLTRGTCPTTCCSELHIISNSVEKLHKMFSWQLFIIIFGIIQSLVTEPMTMYDTPSVDFKFISSFLGILAEGLWALVLVHPCGRLNAQIRAFYKELFRVMRSSDQLAGNKKLVLCLLLEKRASFSIFGLFSLGYPLLGSVIAAATSFFGFFTSMYNTAIDRN